MKKVLLTLIAVLMAVPAFAIEVYNNGEGTSVDIYGTIRGYVGYVMGNTGDTTAEAAGNKLTINEGGMDHNFLYGLQGNSRIGTKFKVGGFSGQVELGANEKTLINKKTDDTVGLRQAWAAYSFGNAGKLLFGKTDTPTSMSGFISDIYDTDGGLNGFGGSNTSTRRFQVQYTIGGLTLALIEDDITATAIGSFTDGGKFTPRGGISYTFKNDTLMAKVAATYTAVNGHYSDINNNQKWTNIHAFGVTAGVKPTFGSMYLSAIFRYGMNEDLYKEAKTVANYGKATHDAYSISLGGLVPGISSIKPGQLVDTDGTVYNVHRAAIALEFGAKVTEQLTAMVGAGYQATIQELGDDFSSVTDPSFLVHSYAVYVQGNYALSKNFSLIPQIAYYGTLGNLSAKSAGDTVKLDDSQGGLLVGMQLRASF